MRVLPALVFRGKGRGCCRVVWPFAYRFFVCDMQELGSDGNIDEAKFTSIAEGIVSAIAHCRTRCSRAVCMKGPATTVAFVPTATLRKWMWCSATLKLTHVFDVQHVIGSANCR